MNGEEKKLSPAQQKKLDRILDQICPISLARRQWIVVYNILVSQNYRLGDARIVNEICDKLQPIVAVDTNIEKEETDEGNKDQVLTN